MNEELVKALTSLIDETIVEIEDLKKSKFSAAEVKIKGPGEDGLKGHPADGKLGKEEDKKDDDKKDDDKDKKDDMDKGENNSADPNAGHHKVAKNDDEDEDDKKEKKDDKDDDKKDMMDKGENNSADPNAGHHKVAKADEYVKKSLDEHNALMKSYIDGRIESLESKLGSILDLVKKVADQPVAPKGASAKNFAILSKSSDEKATLTKSQVADKLFELKKSGKQVDSADITAAELGSTDLNQIINKYGLQ
jgi:hypothetical protein